MKLIQTTEIRDWGPTQTVSPTDNWIKIVAMQTVAITKYESFDIREILVSLRWR